MRRGLLLALLVMAFAMQGVALTAIPKSDLENIALDELLFLKNQVSLILETRGDSVYSNLGYGDRGNSVLRLQVRLTVLGYFTGTISGMYDTNTENAVKLFQKSIGLSVTGTATQEVQDALFSTGTSDGVELILLRTQIDNALESRLTVQYVDLKHGDKGDEVIRLQERLAELGYFTGRITGKYDASTEKAMKQFQKKNGLASTGKATKMVQRVLYSPDAIGQ